MLFRSALRSFEAFLDFAASDAHDGLVHDGAKYYHGYGEHISQSWRIRDKCGEPCVIDYVLHTENLTSDWASMLRLYPGLPRVALPRINEGGDVSDHPWGEAPDTTYTPRMREIVQELDEWVFDKFGYQK